MEISHPSTQSITTALVTTLASMGERSIKSFAEGLCWTCQLGEYPVYASDNTVMDLIDNETDLLEVYFSGTDREDYPLQLTAEFKTHCKSSYATITVLLEPVSGKHLITHSEDEASVLSYIAEMVMVIHALTVVDYWMTIDRSTLPANPTPDQLHEFLKNAKVLPEAL